MTPAESNAEFQRIIETEYPQPFDKLEDCGHSYVFLRKFRFRDEWYCGHPSHQTGETE